MTACVFIDGEAGTTGLQISERLSARRDLSLIHLDDAERKDREARRRALNDADVAILCLPDDAAREAAGLVENNRTRLIDASTAHRTAPEWTYGFPELVHGQEELIRNSTRISNPGCYATATIAMLRPLVDAGLLPADHPVTINAVSGYSGGGKSLIERFEGADAERTPTFYAYGLTLAHKHLAEMQTHARLAHPPLFVPSVARFRQGMLVQVPLRLDAMAGKPQAAAFQDCLAEHYGRRGAGGFVEVAPLAHAGAGATLDPQELNGTNRLLIRLFARPDCGLCLLTATLDNLGKGASGAAVQTLNLVLGLDPATGFNQAMAA
ncbi:MAG: N-acetyl-gamma-glutamyl-phosphate reductase [Alphaproteobacteria bacterium]|nr:N-acetyl-gamma-glutamyl-phosphate reductase [Alphaproteobacteria bacterium]